ncbi:hypothetical protein [Microbacterium immunditiarum]|uniref:Transcriptional regulator, AbiEi antitoxin, Type IV TA system n=1 Tax=Microbacterium immunditiarum TaxID=337480 RepID=A0A7Y9GMN1_9MICO|nr:hypothetical protein [Microbacterium immunditiarum]NYE19307.1 hypothetical protein [Microbacterium immunditiarum]
MPRIVTVADLDPLVLSREDLLVLGSTERSIAAAVATGRHRQIRRGWYIGADEWDELWPEGRHLAHVIAVARDARGSAVMSHESAAVLWGLPLYRHRPLRVHMTTSSPQRISSAPDVMRHVAPLRPTDVAVCDGIRTTSLERTVFDLLRTLRPEPALAAADAAERKRAAREREWDLDSLASWRRELQQMIDLASGARGIRQARRLAPVSDGRAESPGESVSRLHLLRLGFETPSLQAAVPAPHGGSFYVDFGLDDVDAFGEVDGRSKYLDESLRRGVPLEQVLLAEKQREDWIRGTTGRHLVRWEDEHIRTPWHLAERLAAFGIRPPR